jgi:hypothetical protein
MEQIFYNEDLVGKKITRATFAYEDFVLLFEDGTYAVIKAVEVNHCGKSLHSVLSHEKFDLKPNAKNIWKLKQMCLISDEEYEKIYQKSEREKAKLLEKKEREEYERLKVKYGFN